MDKLKADDEPDYDDTSETTLSLYSLAPTETFVDVDDDSFKEWRYSDMEAAFSYYDDDYEYAQQVLMATYDSGDVDPKILRMRSRTEESSEESDEECRTARSFETADEEERLRTALSHIEADTALSEISIYSQYTPAPSETNVEIEYDIIAGASPMSTAMSGSVSWYSLPDSETEIEMQTPLYVGGARVVDSIECLNMLADAKLRPVEDFGNPNIRFLCSGALKSPSEIEEEKYEYSYYSDGPSETNVSMDGVEIFEETTDADFKAVQELPDVESLSVGSW